MLHFISVRYEGAGIYRPVHLVVTNGISGYIVPEGVYVSSEVLGAINRSIWPPTAAANVTVFTEVIPTTGLIGSPLQLRTELIDLSGVTIWSETVHLNQIKPLPDDIDNIITVTQTAHLAKVELWDIPNKSVDEAYLYTLVTTLLHSQNGNAILDSVNTTFGIRQALFDPDNGFYLNGRQVKVQGMCNHQDFAGVGTAVSARIQEFKVRSKSVLLFFCPVPTIFLEY